MGTRFDFLARNPGRRAGPSARKRRRDRKVACARDVEAGLRPYDKEWWHFTLRGEPYPGTYFNFVVK